MQVTPFNDQGYYTEIHNALFDVVMPALKPTSWAILCAIIRQTKGWQRETCPLSVSDLMALCGFGSRHTVVDCLAELRAFRQGARTISLIIEYPGQDQWSAKKIERAAISIASIGGTIELLREYVQTERDRIFKVEFIASDFGGWLARRTRNGANGAGSHSVEYCPACAGSKRVNKTIDGRRRFGACADCSGIANSV